MNMQALMKQAQAMQKDMLNAKNEIDGKEFTAENGLVKVTLQGTKRITKVEITKENPLETDDIEMLEDMILVAVNDALKQIDDETEKKMGKYTKGMPGLF